MPTSSDEPKKPTEGLLARLVNRNGTPVLADTGAQVFVRLRVAPEKVPYRYLPHGSRSYRRVGEEEPGVWIYQAMKRDTRPLHIAYYDHGDGHWQFRRDERPTFDPPGALGQA